MELQQVRYFLTVAEELNCERAAEKCGVRQASVSNAVRRPPSLFLRDCPVQLSKLGVALLPIFVRIYELAEDAQKIGVGPGAGRAPATYLLAAA